MTPDTFLVIRNAVFTFVIGAIAGIAPFIFMQVLPSLMNPDLLLELTNYKSIILTGILIGSITSIIFTSKFKESSPEQIFFYALGVPAILIATVSNFSIEKNANDKINAATVNATSMIFSGQPPNIDQQENKPKELSPPQPMDQSFNIDIGGTAKAATTDMRRAAASDSRNIELAQTTYLLIIDEFTDEKAAWAAYDKYKKLRLRTENYFPKRLGVYELDSSSFALVYGRYSSKDEAIKVYQVLRINDPRLSARLLQY